MYKGVLFICIVVLSGIFWKYSDIPAIDDAVAIKIADVSTASGRSLFLSAKKQIWVVNTYDHGNGYYGNGGYPPDDTWVCTDVIWRTYRDMWIDLKAKIDTDMRKNTTAYSSKFDSNINFRRVKNQKAYFSRTAKSLTTNMIPNDVKNLTLWQAWDIIIFDELPTSHLMRIGIITDIRRKDGVPYMIDNHGYGTNIKITPLDWPTKIVWHFQIF